MNKHNLLALFFSALVLSGCSPGAATLSGASGTRSETIERVVSGTPICSTDATVASLPFHSGDGSAGAPYGICSVAEMNSISNDSVFITKNFKLLQAINFSGESYNMIGTVATPFTGTFDGDHKVISNIILSQAGQSRIGFFRSARNATITNLILENISVTGASHTGGLVGTLDSSFVTNSSVTGQVSGEIYSGGLVGYSIGSMITDCFSEASVIGSDFSGGLVGTFDSGTVLSSYATGTVNGADYAGGLIGSTLGTTSSGNVTDSFAVGAVTGTTIDAYATGGLVGWVYGWPNGSIISNSYSVGAVSGVTGIGGLVGIINQNDASVLNSFWDIESSLQATSAAGTGATSDDMKHSTQFVSSAWDFTSTWTINPARNNGYPYLRE